MSASDASKAHHPATRDGDARRVLMRRNDLLIEAMRRPWPAALAAFGVSARRAVREDADERRALAAAFRTLPGALRMRRVVPEAVERDIRVLADHRGGAVPAA